MGINDLPILPQPKLRPHEINERHKEKFVQWLEERGGLVIYIYYPNDVVNSFAVTPLRYPTRDNLPGDSYVWQDGQILTHTDGRKMVVAPAIKFNKIGDQDFAQIAIDVVLPEMELLPDESLEELLDRAFSWV